MRKAAKTKRPKASKSRLAAAAPRATRRKTAPIALGADCTLREAGALQAQLIAAVPAAASITVDASAVTRIDASALQLLVAFALREQAAGRRIVWQQPSAALCEASARLGVHEVLGLRGAGVPA